MPEQISAMDLKPYPEYKDSEVPSLGDVPSHWQMIRSGYLFREVINTGHPDLELLSIDRFRGIIRQRDIGRKERASKDRSLYKRIRKGQLGYNLMNAFMGSIGISQYEGIISPAYAVGQPQKEMIADYYHHLYRTPIYAAEINRYSYGIMYERNRLYFDYFKRIPVPYPPIDEQKKIVAYLHQEDRKINEHIRAKRRLIELLNEQKQVIISRAVTRGLDPNVRFKPSGIEWLGDIPEQWDVTKGRACYQEKNEPNTGLKETTVLSLSYGKIVVKPEEKLHGLVPASFESYQIVDPGDIICRPTDLQNDWNSLRFGISKDKGIITSAYFCFHTTDLLDRKYGHLLLHTYDLNKVFYGLGSGLRQNLEWKDFKELPCLVPPLPEQKEIVQFVEESTINLDSSIAAVISEIDFLQEYRTCLISDVVTGKVDVRKIIIDEIIRVDENERYLTENETIS